MTIPRSPQAITVSLEMAKKLKEAGWPQNNFLKHEIPTYQPLFAWYSVKPDRDKDMYLEFCEEESNYGYRMYSAPTAEEILRRLPEAIKYPVRNAIEYELFIRPFDDLDERHWEIIYAKDIDNIDNSPLHETTGSLANASASMWIYLKEHNLLPQS